MKIAETVLKWLHFNKKGELDMDRMSQELFLKSLTDKEKSFAIIGIRCNSKGSTGKRKMDAGRLYELLKGYTVTEDRIEVEKWRVEQNTLYDDYYTEISDGKPHIQICAIVGQNGAGKSSIVEFLMRMINNFAASTIGEKQLGEAAERLHFIDGVDGELWYMLGGYPYHLTVKNARVKLQKFSDCIKVGEKYVYTSETTLFDNGLDEGCKKLDKVLSNIGTTELKSLYDNFFYTLVSNQSIYAYNTLDFSTECNSNEKERAALDIKDKEFDYEDRCWLHGIFHKNDGYKTPIVVTPFRKEGNIDINNENLLALERLVSLLALQDDLRRINGHLMVKQLTYNYDPSIGSIKLKAVQRLGFNQLTEDGYNYLRSHILDSWSEVLGRSVTKNVLNRSYFEQALDYITYKTLKVARNYEEHHDFYKKNVSMTDKCDESSILEMVKKQSVDHSHITRKIFQAIAYIWYEVYDLEEKRDDKGGLMVSEKSINFEDLGAKWHTAVIKKERVEMDRTLNYIQRQALILPPFFCMRIDLCDENNPNEVIDFETLSSGEKQQLYAISSILYHLDNIKSAQNDKSNPERIVYKNVNVILEEVELYYHPELQRDLVKYLIDCLDQTNLEGIECVNIIIVTHSPYVLSDIPKTNVLALRKDDAEPELNLKTFGANIHDMLKNSFFLKNGSIGKFAQWEVGHLLACMDVHRWAKENENDTRNCPFIHDEENEAYSFLKRYTYRDINTNTKQFSYEYFNKDLSVEKIKNKIQMIDEPVLYQILMRKLVELEKVDSDE